MPTTSTRTGRWVRQQVGAEGFSAFVPTPLPPSQPLKFSPELQRLSEAAGRALGRLEGVSASLEPDRLLYMYVRKEAVLSSAIEGTQSTLSDLLRFEAEGWTVVSAAEEVFGPGGTLGRETPGDTFLLPRLEAALRSLNPARSRSYSTGGRSPRRGHGCA